MNISAPSLIETLYSLRIYRWINSPLSLLTGIFPISLAEIILFLIVIFAIYLVAVFIYKIIKEKNYLNINFFIRLIKKTFIALMILYLSFLLIWGLNYHRMPFAQSAGLNVTKYYKDDLEELCFYLINKSNALRLDVAEDDNGVMKIQNGTRWVLNSAYFGYDAVSQTYSTLSGRFGTPKPVILSELMCYTGITGIYFPFTGEANVNINVPDSSLPHVVTHEMAHQRGYAREDEANFIAYLTCIHNPYAEFKYSGVLLALTHSMNALYKEDKESFNNLRSLYSEGLIRDLSYVNSFWKIYEGPVERMTDNLNDAYLKANKQKDGVKSYGKMVDLLIAYNKK